MVSPGPVHLGGRSEVATHVFKVNQLHTRTHKDSKQKKKKKIPSKSTNLFAVVQEESFLIFLLHPFCVVGLSLENTVCCYVL